MFTLFGILWAIASLFHVLGPSGRALAFLSSPSWPGFGHIVTATAAIWLLRFPTRVVPLVVLSACGPITAWQEAPALGSHWLLASIVDIGIATAALRARDGSAVDPSRFLASFLPVGTWILVVFYAFAAFAKLNTAFWDPNVSCSTRFLAQILSSFPFTSLPSPNPSAWGPIVPLIVTTTEASIPTLLSVRRTGSVPLLVEKFLGASLPLSG
jgi:hypothetical protein